MKHFIGKQLFELYLPQAEGAWDWQHRVSTLYWGRIMQALENLFDKLSDENQLIQIDRLEINLGAISTDQLEQGAFIDSLIEVLEKELLTHLKDKQKKTKQISSLRGDFEKWMYFLSKGHFPWSVSLLQTNWKPQILETLATESKAIAQLQSLLEENPVARKRLVLQHDNYFLKSIIEVLSAQNQADLPLFIEDWKELGASPQVPSLLEITPIHRDALWQDILFDQIKHRKRVPARQMIQDFLIRNCSKPTLETLAEFVHSSEVSVSFLSQFFEEPPARLKKILHSSSMKTTPKSTLDSEKREDEITTSASNATTSSETSASDILDQTPAVPEHGTNLELFQKDPEQHMRKNGLETGEALYAMHAGLVLLHPFLVPFFGKLGLVESGSFRDQNCQHQAVQLLHYLASGNTDTPEYGLVLPKFLCGVPLNMPLSQQVDLPSAFLEEAQELLQAVLVHWNALGSTSPDGLREGFLMREGKLEKREQGFYLKIEKQAMDLLLDRLPWPLSIVKLPWMKEMLRVEWRQ